MENEVYERLRKRLDMFPTTFPKTADGIEIKILKKFFSEEEAEIACVLPLKAREVPASVGTISVQLGRDANEVRPLLEAMAKKGTAFISGDDEPGEFSLPPFMGGGMHEFSADRMDAELAALIERYYEESLLVELFKSLVTASSKPVLGRIIPMNQTISSESTVLPYEDVAQIIETSSSIRVMPCICRTQKKVLGHTCVYPIETCLFLNEQADHLKRVGVGRKLTKEEAIALLKETEKLGLVHTCENIQKTPVICNCCPCCCVGLPKLIMLAKAEQLALGPKINYRLVIDEDKCNLCEICLGRCWTEALSLQGEHIVHNPKRCLGCGACVSTCPEEALFLVRKPEEELVPTPRDYRALFSQLGWRDQGSDSSC